MSARTAGAVKTDPDEIQGLTDESHAQRPTSLDGLRTLLAVVTHTLKCLSRTEIILARRPTLALAGVRDTVNIAISYFFGWKVPLRWSVWG